MNFKSRLAVLAFLGAAVACSNRPEAVTVAVTQIVDHPSLDAARDGIRDALEEAGYEVGKNLKLEYQCAQGNPATAAQIARQFIGIPADVIVPISTPSAQPVVAATKTIPIVFAAVTDPLEAELVRENDRTGNVTGVSDFPPLTKQLELIKEILPNATRIGVPYNPGDSNSVSLINRLDGIAPQLGLTVIKAPVSKSSEVQAAVRSLVGKSDVVYTMLDNMVLSALEAVLDVGQQNGLPVFSGDTDSVARGTIASVGFDYYDLGRQTGRIVVRVLRGEKAGSIPVEHVEATRLVVNPKAAAAMGVTLPQSLVSRATKVLDE